MADVLVTVPLSFGLKTWIDEGDPAGLDEWSGHEWHFYLWGHPPDMQPRDRVYIVYNRKLRGYAPLVRIEQYDGREYALVRHGGAVACTINEEILGFRGWRKVWWLREQEMPFPGWQIP
jgi:hypothetical protein